MQFLRQNNVLKLHISPDIYFSFKEIWIEDLQKLPMEKYYEYIKKEIYPLFSESEQSVWRKNTVSNNDLQHAINEYLAREIQNKSDTPPLSSPTLSPVSDRNHLTTES